MNLHEITTDIRVIMDRLLEADGEMTPEVEAMLTTREGDLKDKADGYCKAIRQFELEASVAQAEVDRLSRLAEARTKSAQRLKEWLKANLEMLGLAKVETDLFVVRVQKNGRPSISYNADPESLPDTFKRITVALDGQAAYEAWKAGRELPAGFEVKQGSHLRIS